MSSHLTQRLNSIDNAKLAADGLMQLPLLPLVDQVVFPKVLSLIPLTDDAQLHAAAAANDRGHTLIACKLRAESQDEALIDRIHAVGTEIAPARYADASATSRQLLAQGRRRVQIVAIDHDSLYPIATARPLPEECREPQALQSLANALVELFKHSSQYNEAMPDSVIKHIFTLEDPGLLCDSLSAILPLPPDDLQQLLELENIEKRLELLSVLLTTDLRDNELHDEVHTRLQDEIAANQREMYLREQVRIIQQELGDGDVFSQEIKELTAKVHSAELPAEVHDKAMKELSRLGAIPPMSPESGVIHTYLDRLLTLPWHSLSHENLDLAHAEDILERAHYGLKKVKARVLEHIAVRKLARDKMKSPILCFVGRQALAKPRWAKASPMRSAANSCASALGAFATKPKSAATAAPISVPCPAESCSRWNAPRRSTRSLCSTKSTK